MDEKLEIKVLSIKFYYIFCISIYIILFISTIAIVIYSEKIFDKITPNILIILYSKYNWLEKIYSCFIFVVYIFLLIIIMDYFRKYFEKKCFVYFNNNGFTIFNGTEKYLFNKDNTIIKIYKNVAILPAKYSNLNYYVILIYTDKDVLQINTQIIKTYESISNSIKLIKKFKEYYCELEIINNTTFFGMFNKKIIKNGNAEK